MDEENPRDDEFALSFIKIKQKWIGWRLIILGIFIVLERVVYPLIPWEIQRHIQTFIVAAIFIAGGIKLLVGSHDEKKTSRHIIHGGTIDRFLRHDAVCANE